MSASRLAAALLMAVGYATATLAAESLGNPDADALVASLEATNPDRTLTCRLRNDTVLCSGAATGDCLSEGWLISHDGKECRKKFIE